VGHREVGFTPESGLKTDIAPCPFVPTPDIQVHAAGCTLMAGFRSTKSGYVSILFMKMNEIFLHFIAQVTLARRIRRAHAC
jgi:hypothetical protein